jgi:hypothetical protein
LDIWGKKEGEQEWEREREHEQHSSHFWLQAFTTCSSTAISMKDLRWISLRSILNLRSQDM